MRELRSARTTFDGWKRKMIIRGAKNAISEQLSLFALKPTSEMSKQPAGQIMIDLLEMTYPPRELKRYL